MNKVQIEKIIAEREREYADQILDFQAENKQFTATTLITTVNKLVKRKTVGELFTFHIANLKVQKRTGYALSFLEFSDLVFPIINCK